MPKKVLMILSKEFSTDPRVNKEAASLIENGYEVTVICWDRKNAFSSEEVINNIQVVRLNNSLFMNILPHDLLRNPLWWWHAFKKGVALYNKGFEFDAVHCHDLDTLATGVLLKKKLGVKLVYDAHEIFGYMIARDMPSFIVKISFLIEKVMVCKVDHVITVNEPLKEYFRKRTNKPITIVMNCKSLIYDDWQPCNNKTFTVIYIGVLNSARMFPELVDIIGQIDNVKFVIAGKKENIYEEVKNKSSYYENVDFLGTIHFNQVIPKTLESNAIICMFNPNDKNNQVGLPNKVFEAMVTGRPIIVTQGLYLSEFVQKNNCGVTVENNAKSITATILNLRDNPALCEELGRNGLMAAKKKYNWENQAAKLITVYKEFD
jgi:glycosyltransferase involved in cell wall biosynthesis